MILQADVENLPLPDRSVDLVFGSPPYCDCRTYDDGTLPSDRTISLGCRDWVDWMLRVTAECLRVCRGPVVWVAAGPTRGRNYWPACEGLMWRWFDEGHGTAYRPCYWHRVGIPGSGGDQWFRADVALVMCFKRAGALPWSDNTAMGHPPKYRPGGAVSHRTANGSRVEGQRGGYTAPRLANPGTLIKTNAGGGHLGDRLAHENEAPFPERLAEHFIKSLCPPGGTVLDPFSGSGTTRKVALACGREGIATDLRWSQCELTRRRAEHAKQQMSA